MSAKVKKIEAGEITLCPAGACLCACVLRERGLLVYADMRTSRDEIDREEADHQLLSDRLHLAATLAALAAGAAVTIRKRHSGNQVSSHASQQPGIEPTAFQCTPPRR